MADPSALTAPRWSHVGLNCRDLEATESFYRTWFGFQRARAVPVGDELIVFLRNGDSYLELFGATEKPADPPTADGPHQPGTIRHLAFQIDDLDAFLARADGVLPVSLGPLSFDDFIPGWRTVWLVDPDGVVVEVSQGYRDEEAAPVR
jgi:glyoxylase I family protein